LIDTDFSGVYKLLRELDGRELRRALRKGISDCLKLLKRPLVSEVKSWGHNSARKFRGRYGWFYANPLSRDIKVSVYRKGDGGSVSLLDRKGGSNSRAYILRFLNSGTAERYQKGGRRTGAARSRVGFFQRVSSENLRKAEAELDKKVAEAVKKQVSKKRG
jgi:hypothetical protein